MEVFDANHSMLRTKALVRLREPTTMQESWDSTGERSDAIFSGLSPGTYDVEVSAVGYHTQVAHAEVYNEPIQYSVQVILKPDAEAAADASAAPEISAKVRREADEGQLALQAGKLSDAEKHLRKALKKAPDDSQVNYLLGATMLRGKHEQEAEQFFRTAISLYPAHIPALTALGGMLLERKDVPGGVKLLEQAVAANATQWRPHWLLANARLMQENYPAAVTEAQAAIRLSHDSSPASQLILGEALGNLGKYDDSIAALRQFLKQAPGSSQAVEVQKMISQLEQALRAQQSAANPQPVDLSTVSFRLQAAPALPQMSPLWQPPDLDSVFPVVASGVPCPTEKVLSGAGARVKELVDNLGSFSAMEEQTHEELDVFGKTISRENRKSDYLVGISQPAAAQFDLQEYRRDLTGLGLFSDRIATRGLLSLAFVFHPAMQEDYRIDCEGLGEWKGQPTWLVHFRQLPGRPARLQEIATGNMGTYPVPLRGRAWIGAADFQIVHIEAELVAAIPDIELLSEHEIADYAPVAFSNKKLKLWLPADTVIYLDLRRHRYRFSNHYTHFELFSVDSQQKDKFKPAEK